MIEISCRHERTFAFDPGRTALLAIDMQREFLDPAGAMAAAGVDIKPMQAIVPPLATLLGVARAAGLAIVHTREGHAPDLSDLPAAKAAQYAASGIVIGADSPLGRRFVRGAAGHDLVGALQPVDGDWVIDKPGFSAFHATDLDHRLRARGIDALILTGVTTQCCVHSTLRSAIDLGYRCLTVEDACATSDPALHAATMAIVASEGHLFGWIGTTGAVVRGLEKGS